jgi:putative ABC transport system permease protein
MFTFVKDIIKTAFVSLKTRKLRTFLSVLGIVIGILTVSVLLTVALGVRKEVTSSIGNLGASFLAVVPGKVERNITASFGASTLTENDFNSIKANYPELQNLAMASLITGNIKAGGLPAQAGQEISSGLILAGSPGIANDFNFKLASGRLTDQNDENSKATVVVLGDKIRQELFGDANPIGQNITIRNHNFTVVGTLEKVSGGANLGGPDFNNIVLMPLQTGWDLAQNKQIFRIAMQVPDVSQIPSYKDKLKQLILQNHGGEEDFSVFSQDDILGAVNTILNLITAMLSAIAAISLVVAGIGIMNTMLVTVHERTREIGIRKAVGASREDILFQFLVESVMLTLLGGVIAVIIFSLIIAAAGPHSPIPLSFDWRVMGGAILFSVIVGVIFGVFPAYQASRKDPIEALRYE